MSPSLLLLLLALCHLAMSLPTTTMTPRRQKDVSTTIKSHRQMDKTTTTGFFPLDKQVDDDATTAAVPKRQKDPSTTMKPVHRQHDKTTTMRAAHQKDVSTSAVPKRQMDVSSTMKPRRQMDKTSVAHQKDATTPAIHRQWDEDRKRRSADYGTGSYGAAETSYGQQKPAMDSPTTTFSCVGRDNGVYSTDCSPVYSWCWDGALTTEHCPPDMVFNAENGQCDYKERVFECTGVRLTTPAFDDQPLVLADYDCKGLEDGDYPLKAAQCIADFATCSGKLAIARTCPDTLVFDPEMRVCDRPANIVACGGSLPTEPAPVPVQFECPSPNGVFSSPGHVCTGIYFSCEGGVASILMCPEELIWDEKTSTCRDKMTVPDCAFDCTGKENGAYSQGCSATHWWCFDSIATRQSCQDELMFNAENGQCDYPANIVDCGGVRPTEPPRNDYGYGQKLPLAPADQTPVSAGGYNIDVPKIPAKQPLRKIAAKQPLSSSFGSPKVRKIAAKQPLTSGYGAKTMPVAAAQPMVSSGYAASKPVIAAQQPLSSGYGSRKIAAEQPVASTGYGQQPKRPTFAQEQPMVAAGYAQKRPTIAREQPLSTAFGTRRVAQKQPLLKPIQQQQPLASTY